MRVNLSRPLIEIILAQARRLDLDRVILFGSRARGDHREHSDIDLAVKGADVGRFQFYLDEYAPTLLKFDVIDLSRPLAPELLSSIRKDGIILYDKAR